MSRFNIDVGEGLLSALHRRSWRKHGVREGRHAHRHRAGRAGDCRWCCRKWRRAGKFDALIALGAVIRGETYHFEMVSNESGARRHRRAAGYRRADRQRHPTTEDDDQALARMAQKGCEAALVAIEMANLLTRAMDDNEEPQGPPPPARARIRAAGPLPVAARRQRVPRHRSQLARRRGFDKIDREHLRPLLRGAIAEAAGTGGAASRRTSTAPARALARWSTPSCCSPPTK